MTGNDSHKNNFSVEVKEDFNVLLISKAPSNPCGDVMVYRSGASVFFFSRYFCSRFSEVYHTVTNGKFSTET